MAEVKRAVEPSSLSSKKLRSFSINGFTSSSSSSSKHIYDDVFTSPPQNKLKPSTLSSFIDDDYAEIFGSSKSNDGTWRSSYSSIPTLDPPVSEERGCGSRGVDYGAVFGVVGDESFGIPDGEELFEQSKKKAKSSSAPFQRSKEQTTGATRPQTSRQSPPIGQAPTNGFCQSRDNVKHFEHNENEMTMNGTSGATCVANLHAPLGSKYSLHEVSPSQKTQTGKTPVTKDDTKLNGVVNPKHFEHKDIDMTMNGTSRTAGVANVHPPPRSTYSSHEVGLLQKTQTSKTPVIKDDTKLNGVVNLKHFEHEDNDTTMNGTSGAACVANVHTPARSTYSLHEVGSKTPVIKDDTKLNGVVNLKHFEHKDNDTTMNGTSGASCVANVHTPPRSTYSLHEVGLSQKTQTSKTPVIKDDTNINGDANLANKPGKICSDTSSDFGANRGNSEHGASFQKASGLSGSKSVDSSHNTSQASTEVGKSNVIKDDAKVASGFDVKKKLGRHSRVTSLDSGDYKHAGESNAGFQRKSHLGGSYSFDATHDPYAPACIRVQPSRVVPSTSLPQFFPIERHCKIPENSFGKNSGDNFCRRAPGSPPSLDEQLDLNSTAAISAAALQRAIEEAETRIRLARQFLERQGQGSTKLSFKDTLKAKVSKENKHANRINELPENKKHEYHPRVDSTSQTCAHSERKDKLATAQVASVFEDQKEFIQYEEPIDGTNSKASKSTEEGDKHEGAGEWEARVAPLFEEKPKIVEDEGPSNAKAPELIEECDKREGGGEWEATKHLNQLITGVRNRFASFMAWNTETDKKEEEAKEMEASRKSLQQSQEGEWESEDIEVSDMKETGNSICETVCATDTKYVEDKIGFIPQVDELEENESTRSDDVEQEKTGDVVDVIPGIETNNVEHGMEFIPEANKPDENELLRSNTVEQEKACDEEDLIPDIESPTSANFLSFTFRSEVLGGRLEREEEEKKEAQESRELEIENVQEQVIDDVKDEWVQDQFEAPNWDGLDDICMRQDSRKSSIVSSNEDNDEIVEEPYSMAGHDTEEFNREKDDNRRLNEESGEEPMNNSHHPENSTEIIEKDGMCEECEVLKQAENQQENIQVLEEANLVQEIEKKEEMTGEMYGCEENERDEGQADHVKEVTEEISKREEKRNHTQTDYIEETTNEDECKPTGNVFSSNMEEACRIDASSPCVQDASLSDEESEKVEITNPSFEPTVDIENPVLAQKVSELIGEERVLTSFSTENAVELVMEDFDGSNETLQCENFVLPKSEIDVNSRENDVDGQAMESESQDFQNQADYLDEPKEILNVGEANTGRDQEGEKCGLEAAHRRRRWFESGQKVGAVELPSILEGDRIQLDIDREAFNESDFTGSVEIHTDKQDSKIAEVSIEATHKRRRWFVKKGEEGLPEPPSLFEGIEVTSEVDGHGIENESLPHNMSDNSLDELNNEFQESLNELEADVGTNGEKANPSFETPTRRKRWFESGEKVGIAQQLRNKEDVEMTVETDEEPKTRGFVEKHGTVDNMCNLQEKGDIHKKEEPVNEPQRDMDEVSRREKKKERIAVERAIREARERAFAEARERARRDALEKPNVEPQQRVPAGAQDRMGKVSSTEASSSSSKASMEAKLKAERAAVERATAEARERALQRALSEKASHRSMKTTPLDPKYQSSSSNSRSSDSSNKGEKFDGADDESAQRRKARMERQRRTTERAATALEEKNRRDLIAQEEQAARNILADSLDAEVKRWSCGKEGNLRALLSTLQYILGPDSGWQAISLTDLVATTAVRKAYKKANLCVHPDKLQQRGASVQQKYICEKVFDILKNDLGKGLVIMVSHSGFVIRQEAWSKFNPDER